MAITDYRIHKPARWLTKSQRSEKGRRYKKLPEKMRYYIILQPTDILPSFNYGSKSEGFQRHYMTFDDPVAAGLALESFANCDTFDKAIKLAYDMAWLVPNSASWFPFSKVAKTGDIAVEVKYTGERTVVKYLIRNGNERAIEVPFEDFASLPLLFLNAEAVANITF